MTSRGRVEHRASESERKGNLVSEEQGQQTGVEDKNYNLIAVLYQSSDNVLTVQTYVQDAEREGD